MVTQRRRSKKIKNQQALYRQYGRWHSFCSQNSKLCEYLKPYRTPNELISKLARQGMLITPNSLRERIIFENNYFRLKAYLIPFLKGKQKFNEGTYFSSVYRLYLDDQSIRDFIFPILAKLEVRIRSILDNVITAHQSDPFWHLNKELFTNYSPIEKVLNKAEGRFSTSTHPFAIHYRGKYFTRSSFEYKKIPPFWIISEIFTLEHLLSVMRSIDKDRFAIKGGHMIHECAVKFGFKKYDSLVTSLGCMLEMRNICAHHSRLWNKNLRAPSDIATATVLKPTMSNRLYPNLVMIRKMCQAQKIDDKIKFFFLKLFESNPTMKKEMHTMGFPPNWESDPHWS